MKPVKAYVSLSPGTTREDLRALKVELEVREHEFNWLESKLKGMEFPHIEGHSAPQIRAAFGTACRHCYIWVYGLTTEMACMLAGEIEERTGCEMVKYNNESDWNISVEYKFKGLRAGRVIVFDFVAADVEGCRVVETDGYQQKIRKVVCS